jgi:hypothetical protein
MNLSLETVTFLFWLPNSCLVVVCVLQAVYYNLGCKLVVGMPFKDIATTDAIYMRTIPPSSNKKGRQAIKRLQVGHTHITHTHTHFMDTIYMRTIPFEDLKQAGLPGHQAPAGGSHTRTHACVISFGPGYPLRFLC